MRLRFVFCALLAFAPGCKKFFSFGHASDAGTGGGGGGISSMLASLVGFEGEIDMAVSAGAGAPSTAFAMTITMKLKGDRMRMELNMPGLGAGSTLAGATIMDAGKKKTWTLMPATKEYVESDLDPAAKTAVPATTKPVVTKSGRTDKIAGYSCDIITVAQPGKRERTEFCMSKGLTFLGMGMGPFSSMGNDEFGDVMKEGFPLRMESFDASGTSIMKMEATRIDKKSEPDSDFEVPAGWKKMTTPGYGGGGPVPTTTTGSGGYTF